MEDMTYADDHKKEDPGTPGEEVPQLNLELEEWASNNSDQIIFVPSLVKSDVVSSGNFDFVINGKFEIPEDAKPIRMWKSF